MKKRILAGALLNVVTFGCIVAIGVVMAGVFVRAYGLSGYGVLILARLLLPTGLVGLADLGFPLAITRRIAEFIALDDRERAGGIYLIAAAAALLLGTAILFAASLIGMDALASRMGLEQEEVHQFSAIAWPTLLLLPLLFCGTMASSILEGAMRFSSIRLTELATMVGFATAAIILVVSENSVVSVGLAYLISQAIKCVILVLIVASLPIYSCRIRLSQMPQLVGELGRVCMALLPGRMASTLMQFATPAVVSAISGPTGAATYDLLQRLPRFTKTTTSMVNSVFLPAAVHFRATGTLARERQLLLSATRLSLTMGTPIAFVGCIFADEILRYWIGSASSQWSYYFQLAWLYPLMAAWAGPAGTILVSRTATLWRQSYLAIFTCVIFFSLGLAMAKALGALGFVVAWPVAATVSAILTMRLVAKSFEITLASLAAPLITTALVIALPAMVSELIRHFWPIDSPGELIAQVALNAFLAIVCLWYLALRPSDREFARELMPPQLRTVFGR